MEPFRKPWIEKDDRTGNWSMRWRECGVDGKLHKRSIKCGDYSDAVNRRNKKEDELRSSGGARSNSQEALAPIYYRYMKDMERIRELRPGSLVAKHRALDAYVEKTRTLNGISRPTLIDYRDSLFESVAPTTVGIRMREVKAFVRWIHFEGFLPVNHFVNIELPRQDPKARFLTDDELVTLDRACAPALIPIVRLAYLTGPRQNEILKAKWEDIHWIPYKNKAGETEIGAFWTVWAITSKNRRSRTIFLKKSIVNLFGPKQKSGRIFKNWNVSNLRWAFDCAKKAAGLTGKVRFHDLRHTFCRIYLEGGGGLRDLMEVTGHRSIKMMEVYAHFETRYRAERMEAIQLPDALTDVVRDSFPFQTSQVSPTYLSSALVQ